MICFAVEFIIIIATLVYILNPSFSINVRHSKYTLLTYSYYLYYRYVLGGENVAIPWYAGIQSEEQLETPLELRQQTRHQGSSYHLISVGKGLFHPFLARRENISLFNSESDSMYTMNSTIIMIAIIIRLANTGVSDWIFTLLCEIVP